MAFSERKFLKYYKNSDFTEEEKLERIRICKGMLQPFVDAAYGQHPVQLCQETPKEKYLQSPDQEVESKKLSRKFKKETVRPLSRKFRPKYLKKETVNHAKPS